MGQAPGVRAGRDANTGGPVRAETVLGRAGGCGLRALMWGKVRQAEVG